MFAPVLARAGETTRTPRADITIEWNGELDRAHGVRSGRGTPDNPYVISGWEVANISIRDTDKAIKIVNNTITGKLTLDWIGPNVVVRNNDVGDLRLNQNIARWGDPSGGMIVKNRFGQVGQLRHFDGVFAHNTVGSSAGGGLSPYPATRAVNFDGFNGSRFEHNTIYGYVDARLHGHHHSSAFGDSSHMHATDPADAHTVDHTMRYHQVFIEHNEIFTSHGYALAYLDTNHAANDRTANSETNPYLNAPHVHRTRTYLRDNELNGAGILVDVFNAQDERHKGTRRGLLVIAENVVTLQQDAAHPFRTLNGIEVRQARDLRLAIKRNQIQGPEPITDLPELHTFQMRGAGILLDGIDDGAVWIVADQVINMRFGVQATQLSESVTWMIRSLSTDGVVERVSYDESVRNAPRS